LKSPSIDKIAFSNVPLELKPNSSAGRTQSIEDDVVNEEGSGKGFLKSLLSNKKTGKKVKKGVKFSQQSILESKGNTFF
jgi:hypothetical protein